MGSAIDKNICIIVISKLLQLCLTFFPLEICAKLQLTFAILVGVYN